MVCEVLHDPGEHPDQCARLDELDVVAELLIEFTKRDREDRHQLNTVGQIKAVHAARHVDVGEQESPAIGDSDRQLAIRCRRINPHRYVGDAMRKRIAEKVREQLPDTHLIAVDRFDNIVMMPRPDGRVQNREHCQ